MDDKDVVQYAQVAGLAALLLGRLPGFGSAYTLLERWISIWFQIRVAGLAIRTSADAVIMYNTACDICFGILKKKAPQICRVMDHASAPKPYLRRALLREIKKGGHRDLVYEDMGYLLKRREIRRSQKEIDGAQYHLAASTYVRDGLARCGVPAGNIFIVPYGSNIIKTNGKYEDAEKSVAVGHRPLELFYAGQVVYRKGVVQLMEAVSQFGEDEVHVTLTGAYDASKWYIRKYAGRPGITFTGAVTFDRMEELYQKADIFVIDSYTDGMALVGIEAMSCGLPVVCSEYTGVKDLVKNGKNGFVIKAGDTGMLVNTIRWFLAHREQIALMGREASETASKYTWDNYEDRIISVMDSICSRGTDDETR